MTKGSTKLPVPHRIAVVRATRADNDEQLLQSWLKSLSSPHTQRNFETTARRVLAELPMGLREAAVEDVRTALGGISSPSRYPISRGRSHAMPWTLP